MASLERDCRPGINFADIGADDYFVTQGKYEDFISTSAPSKITGLKAILEEDVLEIPKSEIEENSYYCNEDDPLIFDEHVEANFEGIYHSPPQTASLASIILSKVSQESQGPFSNFDSDQIKLCDADCASQTAVYIEDLDLPDLIADEDEESKDVSFEIYDNLYSSFYLPQMIEQHCPDINTAEQHFIDDDEKEINEEKVKEAENKPKRRRKALYSRKNNKTRKAPMRKVARKSEAKRKNNNTTRIKRSPTLDLPEYQPLMVGSRYHCRHCDKNFERKSNHDSHARVHYNVKPFACSKCGKKFVRNSDKKRHEKSHAKTVPSVCLCNSHSSKWGCSRNFQNVYQLKNHWKDSGCVDQFFGKYRYNVKYSTLSEEKLDEMQKNRTGELWQDVTSFALLQLERQIKWAAKSKKCLV